MKVHLPYLKILEGIKEDTESGLWSEQQIRCKTGEWVDSAALKLQKDSWTVGGMGEGVFFSVWVGEDDVRKGRFNYNIHALKLRLWEGYAIKSNDFASSFRDRMQGELDGWPNVRIDYGPQTLMQGWRELDEATFENDVLSLIDRFEKVHEIIDELLNERKL